MPSQFSSLWTDHAIPVLTDQLAESIVRYPLGDLLSPVFVTGIWIENEAQDSAERGHENLRKVELTLLDGTIPDTRDCYALPADWTSAGDVAVTPPPKPWIVRAIERPSDPDPVVSLEFREMEIRTGKGGRVL